jgi:hypothetical protein
MRASKETILNTFQLKVKSGGVEKILEGYNALDNDETKDFCFPGSLTNY